MKIVKRDGHIVDYDPEKIRVAIGKANEEVRGREKATKEEINRFNAKFEFYTGSEISAESVKTLLDVVKDHLESVDITPLNTASTSTSEKIKERIKLNIKKDNPNVDLATGIKEKLEENEKYDIAITYSDKTGIIETLTIEPNKK